MIHELNIFSGRLTHYQLSEALEIPIDQVEDILSREISIRDLCPELINKIHHLENALFGHVKK